MLKLLKNKLFLILLLASALRLFSLSHTPPSLNWDEVSMGYSAYSLSETGRDEWGERLPLFFRSYGEWKSAVYIYLLVPFVKLLGNTALAVRLPSAIAGIISVYLTYLIGTRLYSRRVGLFASLFLAVSPFALMLSRPGFEANLALTLVLAGIYFFISAIPTMSYKLLAISSLAFGLAPHTYNSAKVVVPLLVLYLLVSTKLYRNLRQTLLYLGILAVFAIPILLNLFSGVSQARLSQVGVTTDQKALGEFYALRQSLPSGLDKLVVNKLTFSLYQTSDNYLRYFSPSFLLTAGGTHHQHSLPYRGVLYFSEFVLLFLGLTLLRKQSTPLKYLPLVLILLGFLPASMTRDQGHVLRSILTLPGWQLLTGLGASHILKSKSKWNRWLIGLFVIEVVSFLLIYFSWYPKAFARDWQYGHQEVASYLAEHDSEYNQIVMTKWFGEPQLFLAYYNHWDPAVYQLENKANLLYESEGRMWLDQLPEYSLGKYTFKYLEWDKESQKADTLYIGKFDDFPSDAHTLETIYYPDGTVAFVIVRGDK